MDHNHYEILHTAQGSHAAGRVRALIDGEPRLAAVSRAWQTTSLPASAALYSLVVIASDDLGADAAIRTRVAQIFKRGFPCMLVVDSCATYDFRKPPIPALSATNAVGLDTPEFLVETLLHHAGLRHAGTGGQVFISYARRDATPLANTLRETLQRAGFRAFVDRKEIAGGVDIQRHLEREMHASDLVLLIDSEGAANSPWVDEEIDLARVAHVPVVAVMPAKDAFQHRGFTTPHVPWGPADDLDTVAANATHLARRVLARRSAFRDRLRRTLERVCTLRDWTLVPDGKHWQVSRERRVLRVACTEDTPTIEEVLDLRDLVGDGHGMLVGGTRPYTRTTARGLAELGGEHVCATPLPRAASKLPTRIAPRALAGRRIFLSAAVPNADDAAAENAAQTLAPFVVTFIQTVVDLGATIVFGGHPTVTPLVHRALVDIAAEGAGVELHLAQFWVDRDEVPPQADDRRVFHTVHHHGAGKHAAADVQTLRDGMIRPGLDAAVFIGGKTHDYHGTQPGIVDEYERFRSACPAARAFVLGMAGGAAALLLERSEPPRDALDPRLTHELRVTSDPDLATALIVAELIHPTT